MLHIVHMNRLVRASLMVVVSDRCLGAAATGRKRNTVNPLAARVLRDGHDAVPDGSDLGLDLDGFFEAGDPWIFISSEQDFLHLSDVLSLQGGRLKLRVFPYDIVFLS